MASKVIAIVGKSGVGKTTLANNLIKFIDYKRIITYTTRPPRENEVDGVDYHFISLEDFIDKMDKGFFAENAVYDTIFAGECWYGSSKESYMNNEPGKKVIVLNPSGVVQLYNYNIHPFVIYLTTSEHEIVQRLKARGDNVDEISRRLKTDHEDFEDLEEFDKVHHIVSLKLNTEGLQEQQVQNIVISAIGDTIALEKQSGNRVTMQII